MINIPLNVDYRNKVVGDVKMIKLSQVRDALYDVSMETSCYFNKKV